MGNPNPAGRNYRPLFERYLHDYLIKRGFNETADIFRTETNVPIDPPEIDVPDGFLHEWWLIFYDMFKAWQINNPQHNGGSSSMGEGGEHTMNMWQQSVPSSSRQHELNEEMIRELTVDTDVGVIIGGNLQPIKRPISAETGPNSLALKSSPPSGNLSDTATVVLDSLVQANRRTKRIAPNESGRNRKKSVDSEDGSIGMPRANTSLPETSLTIPKDLEDFIQLSSSCVQGKKDESGGSSSKDHFFRLFTSLVEGKKNEGGDSSSVDGNMTFPSHFKGNKEEEGVSSGFDKDESKVLQILGSNSKP